MSKNNVDSLCFVIILSLGLLSSSAYMSFMYIMYYIFKAGSIVLLSTIMWTIGIDQAFQSSTH